MTRALPYVSGPMRGTSTTRKGHAQQQMPWNVGKLPLSHECQAAGKASNAKDRRTDGRLNGPKLRFAAQETLAEAV